MMEKINDAGDLRDALTLTDVAMTRANDGTVRLLGSECADCGKHLFPPAEVCPECLSENLADLALGATGTLYSWSVVHAAPKGWNLPFIAAYVDLPDDVRVFTHIVDADPASLSMDMPVSIVVATLGTQEDGAPFESFAFTPTGGGQE
jgi:uncharacterized OB-fold protein